MKIYQDKSVYDASIERLNFIFDEFENVLVSFSGGKDSGVLLNLALEVANQRKRKLIVFIVDLEAQYKLTIEYLLRMIEAHLDTIEIYWCCLPLNLRNAVSNFTPFWTCWDLENRDKWVREYPNVKGLITEENHNFNFFYKGMEFEEFTPKFAEWLRVKKGKNLAVLVGIRCDESLNRFRTIASDAKTPYKNKRYSTKIAEGVFNFYPIYDWKTRDIWIANSKFEWDYNRLYDLFYKAGLNISEMRICQPYGDDQRVGINLFKVVEPETWQKIISRTSGANFGNIYCKTKMLGYHKVELPSHLTWKRYTKLLLSTLPKELSDSYKKKFIKFIRFWSREGGSVSDQTKMRLKGIVYDRGVNSNRGGKKPLSVFKKIPDFVDGGAEAKKECPTWRRMAYCIIKNDVLCKGLSFTQTKEQVLKQREILEKYKNL